MLDPKSMLLRVPAILLALTIHELAHAWIARWLGDPTAEREGRISLNPLKHLDPFGALMLLFGPFGWAKPVPVNPVYFSDPKKGMALVAAAGPISNIILAGIVGLGIRFGLANVNEGFYLFMWILFTINIGLAVFNLLPIYPLDGSRIVMGFLSGPKLDGYLRAMTVVPKVFLFMIVAEWLFHIPVLSFILNPIFRPAFRIARTVFIGA